MVRNGFLLSILIFLTETLNISGRVTTQVKTAAETVKTKVDEIDTKFKVSEKAHTVKNTVEEKTTKIKQDIENAEVTKKITTEVNEKISPELNTWFGSMSTAATSIYSVAKDKVSQMAENPTIAKGIGIVSGATTYVTSSITGLQEETKHAIDEINRTRAVQQPPSAVPPTHSGTPGGEPIHNPAVDNSNVNINNNNSNNNNEVLPPPSSLPPVEKPGADTEPKMN